MHLFLLNYPAFPGYDFVVLLWLAGDLETPCVSDKISPKVFLHTIQSTINPSLYLFSTFRRFLCRLRCYRLVKIIEHVCHVRLPLLPPGQGGFR